MALESHSMVLCVATGALRPKGVIKGPVAKVQRFHSPIARHSFSALQETQIDLYCLNCLYSMLSSISLLKLREDIRNLMLIIFMLPKGCQTKLLSDNQSGPISGDSKVYVYLITENNRYVFQIIQGTGTRANSEIFQKGLRRKFWKNVMSYSLKTEQMNIPHSLFLFFFFWFFFFFALFFLLFSFLRFSF